MKTILALLLLVSLTSCSTTKLPKFPNIDAEGFYYSRHDPLGGTDIKVEKLTNTPTEVVVEKASWTTTYPQFNITAGVAIYHQKKDTPVVEIKTSPSEATK